MFPTIKPDIIPVERRWRCHPIEAGHACCGWKIGPLVTCVVHWSGAASKPCHHAMSEGVLPCACREVKVATRKIGYLPLWLQTRDRVVVIVSNTVAAQIDPLPHGTPIKLARPLTPCAPLRYSEWAMYEAGEEQTKRVAKWVPSDIETWLLHLWQDDRLTSYFAGLRSAGVKNPSVVEVKTETPSLGADQPARDNRLSLIRKASKNGKHAPN